MFLMKVCNKKYSYNFEHLSVPYMPAALYPQKDSWYSFLLEAESGQGHSVAGRIKSIEKSNYLTGNRTCNLLACSIVPQPYGKQSPQFIQCQ
jgi:hypothetical protein